MATLPVRNVKYRKRQNDNSTLKKVLKNTVPFAALVGYTAATAGIYLVVEENCGKDGDKLPLTFWSSFHFIASLETTIGYGDFYPCTVAGRALSIVFALVGLPLALICLERLGRGLERGVTALWHGIERLSGPPQKRPGSASEHDVPISFAILFAIIWILVSSAYFYFSLKSVYELNTDFQWDFFMAFYFTMISFLTIGLGDVAPIHYDYVFINYVFMLFGLAFVTMCITIIQTKLEHLFDHTQKMIKQEYATKILQQEPGQQIPEDENYQQDVKALMKKSSPTWLRSLISERDMARLVEQYKKDCQMVNQQTQTVVKEMKDESLETEGDDNYVDMVEEDLGNTSICANCGKVLNESVRVVVPVRAYDIRSAGKVKKRGIRPRRHTHGVLPWRY